MSSNVETAGSSRTASRRTSSKRPWAIVLIILVVLLALWLILSGILKPKKKTGPPPPIPVAEGQVKTGNIDVYLDELGTVTPVYTVTVASRVAGSMPPRRWRTTFAS